MSPLRERFFSSIGRFQMRYPYVFILILAILSWLGLIAGYEFGRWLLS